MGRRIPTNGSVVGANGNKTNTYIGAKETFLDRNAKLVPSDETTTALTNMNWIAGHHTVSNLTNLYLIPDFILSQECYADQIGNGADALGQLWYVEDENRFYQLVNWDNRHEESGWALSNIKSVINPTTGKVNVSYFNTNEEQDVLTSKTEWITSITMYGDGTYTYTIDGLHLNKSTSTYTYSKNSSTSSFNVIDSINYNPSLSNPHQLSYNVKTVEVLSQNHHDGSIEGDFLTSASLSSTGTLSGSYGTFKNEAKLGNNYSTDLGAYPDKKDLVPFLDTEVKKEYCAPDASVSFYCHGSYILTNVSIDSNGKLSYSQAMPRNWVHDDITTYNDSNNVWYTYLTNNILNVGYIPVAMVKGDNLSSYEYIAGIINDDLMKRYENKFNAISISSDNLTSYFANSYSYIRDFINKNVLINSLNAYSGPSSTYLGYNINDKYNATYFKPATSNNQGPLSAYTYNYFDNHVTDIENRLSAKEITKSKQTPIYKVKWTVYKADGTSTVATYINNRIVTVERGCYVQGDDMSINWSKTSSTMIPLVTSGSWGNNITTAITSTDSIYSTVTPNKSWNKQQVTSNTDTKIYQTITGITTYGASTLITKQNSVGEWVLQRKNATNTQSTTDGSTFYINVSQPINYWYGFTTENPAKWIEGSNITDLLINTIEKTTNNGKLCFTKGTKSEAKITITNGNPITLNNTTTGSPGYFVYIYRTEYGVKLKSAVLNNSNDVTAAFSFGLQKKVKITSRTNGYVQEYWVLWSSGVNSINWPTKFDLT